jgi:hypothetical protein
MGLGHSAATARFALPLGPLSTVQRLDMAAVVQVEELRRVGIGHAVALAARAESGRQAQALRRDVMGLMRLMKKEANTITLRPSSCFVSLPTCSSPRQVHHDTILQKGGRRQDGCSHRHPGIIYGSDLALKHGRAYEQKAPPLAEPSQPHTCCLL